MTWLGHSGLRVQLPLFTVDVTADIIRRCVHVHVHVENGNKLSALIFAVRELVSSGAERASLGRFAR